MKKLILLMVLVCGVGVTSSFSQAIIDAPRDGVYTKEHIYDSKPVPYPFLREADVMWARRIWRVIDMREKINHPFYFPETPANGRKSFMYTLMDAISEGTIIPYKYDAFNDEFLNPMTPDDVDALLSSVDTLEMVRPYPPYDTYDTIVRNDFNPSDVKKIRVKEDWFFDRERSVLEVRIIGIAPVKEEFEEDGETVKGDKPLFWIYFDEARPLFAKTETFNRFNQTERRSYDDIFMKRMFGSYIYKKENVYDRKIDDYAKGIDALLESDKIREEIFYIEHDLWEF